MIYIIFGAGLGLMAASSAVVWDAVTRQTQFACERDKLVTRQLLFTGLLVISALVVGGAMEHLLP